MKIRLEITHIAEFEVDENAKDYRLLQSGMECSSPDVDLTDISNEPQFIQDQFLHLGMKTIGVGTEAYFHHIRGRKMQRNDFMQAMQHIGVALAETYQSASASSQKNFEDRPVDKKRKNYFNRRNKK